MKYFRIFLLSFVCTLLLAGASFTQAVTQTAAATWQVQKYNLDVTIPPDNGRSVTVRGVLSIKNVSGKPASTLTFRIAPSAAVATLKINEFVVDFTKNEEKINAASTLQRIAARFASVSPDTVLPATVDYKINLKDNAALSYVFPNAAQFLPLSYWYPTPNPHFFARRVYTPPVRINVNPSH